MDNTTVYTRSRSSFYLRVNENEDGSYNFFISESLRPMFNYHFGEVEDASPTGWKSGKNNIEYIWVPENRADEIDVDEIKDWAEFAGKQCIWLGLSRHLHPHFTGNEIDYCIAADFNFTTDGAGNIGARSALGEAEWKLKYHFNELAGNEQDEYCKRMSRALLEMIGLLPVRLGLRKAGFGLVSPPLVSPIPAPSNLGGLAWVFAEHVANQKGLEFLRPILLVSKPKMKEISIEEKIENWNVIYATTSAVDINPKSVKGKTVIVIDDLYQSGVTIWAYAKFLKGIGAHCVYGLACVKSMKDTDNQ